MLAPGQTLHAGWHWDGRARSGCRSTSTHPLQRLESPTAAEAMEKDAARSAGRFTCTVSDPSRAWLIAAAKLTCWRMMAIMWASPTESYWQSLRVAKAARGRGIAAILF